MIHWATCYSLTTVEKDGKLMYIDHSGDVVWQEKWQLNRQYESWLFPNFKVF